MKQRPPPSFARNIAMSSSGLGFTIITLILLGHYLDAQLNTGTNWTIAGVVVSVLLLLASLIGLVITLLRNGQ
jgi:hypothetical protein